MNDTTASSSNLTGATEAKTQPDERGKYGAEDELLTTREKAKEEREARLKESGERPIKDDEVKDFRFWIDKMRDEKKPLNAVDFAEAFFFRYTGAEEITKEEEEARIRKQRENFEARLKKYEKQDPSWSQKLKNNFKEIWSKYIWRLGKGIETLSWERVMGQLLDKRVSEIQSANLNARDRVPLFERACELHQKFEAQAFLLSLGHTSDLTEGMVETYYKYFGREKLLPVYDSFTKQAEVYKRDKEGRIVRDEKGSPLKEAAYKKGYLGDIQDMWFEQKLRRETHTKGHRPDVWHGGWREFVKDDKGKIIGVCFKSQEWQADEADQDAFLTPGRKGDVAAETHAYQFIGDDSQVEATVYFLNRKLETLPELIKDLKEERDDIQKKLDGEQASFVARSHELEEDEKIKVKLQLEKREDELAFADKKIADEELRVKLIEKRLIKGAAKNEIKSLLLDPTERQEAYEYTDSKGKIHKIYEADVAVSLDTRKYWQARSEKDAGIITRAEHVTSFERELFISLMSDSYRSDFEWSCQHWWLGVRKDGRYDPQRDAAKNLFEVMCNDEQSAGFSNRALDFEEMDWNKDKKLDKVVIKDRDGVLRQMPDELVKNIEKLRRFHVSDSQPEIKSWTEYQGKAVEKKEEPREKLSPLSQALLVGKSKALEVIAKLPERDLRAVLDRSWSEILHEYKPALSGYLPKLVYQEGGVEKEFDSALQGRLEEGLQRAVNSLEIGQKLGAATVDTLGSELGLNENQKAAFEQAVERLNQEKILPLWQAKKVVDELKAEAKIVDEISAESEKYRDPETFAQLLGNKVKGIDGFVKPELFLDDPLGPPGKDQQEKAERLSAVPISGSVKTLEDLAIELKNQANWMRHVIARLAPKADETEKKEDKKPA